LTHLLAQTYTDVSQGGRFDGILGVLAGLEVIKAMNASDHKPWADIAIINGQRCDLRAGGCGNIQETKKIANLPQAI